MSNQLMSPEIITSITIQLLPQSLIRGVWVSSIGCLDGDLDIIYLASHCL